MNPYTTYQDSPCRRIGAQIDLMGYGDKCNHIARTIWLVRLKAQRRNNANCIVNSIHDVKSKLILELVCVSFTNLSVIIILCQFCDLLTR